MTEAPFGHFGSINEPRIPQVFPNAHGNRVPMSVLSAAIASSAFPWGLSQPRQSLWNGQPRSTRIEKVGQQPKRMGGVSTGGTSAKISDRRRGVVLE